CRANGEVGGSKPLELAAPPRGMGWGGPVLEADRGAVEGGATSVAMCASVLPSASGYQGICIHRSVDRGGDDRTIREGEPVSTVEVCALRTCPVPCPSPPPLPRVPPAAPSPAVPRRRGCITSMRCAPGLCCWVSCSIPCCPSSPEGCGCSRTPGQLSGPRRPS